jgi:hypothetical protein
MLCKLHDARNQTRAICTISSGQWQQMRGAPNVQVTQPQQLGTVPRKAALDLLSLHVGMTKTSVMVRALITCLSALPLMVGLTGCAGDRYNQGTGQRMEANRTAERVREALAAGADYKYDGVKVVACNGVVQLSGFVNTSAQRNSAGEITSKVVGVKSVENNLMVKD